LAPKNAVIEPKSISACSQHLKFFKVKWVSMVEGIIPSGIVGRFAFSMYPKGKSLPQCIRKSLWV
jgi:hypothetical protein